MSTKTTTEQPNEAFLRHLDTAMKEAAQMKQGFHPEFNSLPSIVAILEHAFAEIGQTAAFNKALAIIPESADKDRYKTTDPDGPAFPGVVGGDKDGGLTTRAYIATQCLSGLLACPDSERYSAPDLALAARDNADALIEALNQPAK